MKTAFFFSSTGLFLALTVTNVTYSQGASSIAKFKSQLLPEKNVHVSKQLSEARNPNLILRNEINIKAIRHFMKEYQTISDAKWLKSPNGGFAVYFISENIRSTIYYSKKGTYQWMIRHYNEDKLPGEVRHLVKRNYYDFDIYNVTEITRNAKTFYAIKLEDKISWKTIKVEDDVIEVIEEFFKL